MLATRNPRSVRSCLPLVLPLALLASACSQERAEEASAASEEADAALPSVSGAVTAGVAFTARYAFILPPKAIAGVQEEHVAACSRLGTSRCRVTGVEFDQSSEDSVSASTDFLLAPDLALSFGNGALAPVERAKGKLDAAQLSGENAGGAITLSQQDSAAVQAEVERIEARLAAKGLARQERADLSNRVEALREQLRGQQQERRSKEAALASTPVSFTYASESALSGNPFSAAAATSWSSAQSVFAFLLVLAGFLLPWLVPAGLAVLLIRYLRRRRAVGEQSVG